MGQFASNDHTLSTSRPTSSTAMETPYRVWWRVELQSTVSSRVSSVFFSVWRRRKEEEAVGRVLLERVVLSVLANESVVLLLVVAVTVTVIRAKHW